MGSQDFNEPVFVVLPGHYESAASASQSDPNAARTIIRIIGCDNNGYWLDSDGKRYTESDLQYNWVALDTVPTLNTSKKQTAALFRGFKPTPDPNGNGPQLDKQEPYQYQSYGAAPDDIAGIDSTTYGAPPHDIATNDISTPEPPLVATAGANLDSLQRPNASNRTRNQHQSISSASDKFNEIDFLLNKAHIDVLNQQSQENYGISKYKPTVIQLNLEFEIPYDLSKIQQIIELFNLKPIDVVNYLYQSVEYPEASIKQKLRNLLIPDTTQNNVSMEAPRPTFEPPKTVLYTASGSAPDAATKGPMGATIGAAPDDIAGIDKSTSGATLDDIASIGKAPTGRTSGTTPEPPLVATAGANLDSLQRPNASIRTEKKKPNFFDF